MKCYKNILVDFYCKSCGRFRSVSVRCTFLIPEAKTFSFVAESGLNYPLFLQDHQGVFTEYVEPEEYGVYMSSSSFDVFVQALKEYGFDVPEDV